MCFRQKYALEALLIPSTVPSLQMNWKHQGSINAFTIKAFTFNSEEHKNQFAASQRNIPQFPARFLVHFFSFIKET